MGKYFLVHDTKQMACIFISAEKSLVHTVRVSSKFVVKNRS